MSKTKEYPVRVLWPSDGMAEATFEGARRLTVKFPMRDDIQSVSVNGNVVTVTTDSLRAAYDVIAGVEVDE